jgi:hypothetical protein
MRVGGIALLGGPTSGAVGAIFSAGVFALIAFWVASRPFWWRLNEGWRYLIGILAAPFCVLVLELLKGLLIPR